MTAYEEFLNCESEQTFGLHSGLLLIQAEALLVSSETHFKLVQNLILGERKKSHGARLGE